ncbi:type II secretion system protein [Sulfurospirillum sp. 1307]
MNKSAFTMVELIFVIVIIGILASVAIPKLTGVSDGAKKSAEIATISAVVTAIESAHGEWSINEGDFTWGNKRSSSELNSHGYPNKLGDPNDPFNYVIKNSKNFKLITEDIMPGNDDINISVYTGPASDSSNGVKFPKDAPNSDILNKPDKNDFWVYASYIKDKCTLTCTNCSSKVLYSGDFVLIDVNNTGTKPTPTCN